MTFVGWYLALSTVALGFVGSFWGTTGWHNIAIKFVYVALAVCGAIATAAALHLTAGIGA